MTYSLDQWLSALGTQPAIPGGVESLPHWLRDFARLCREGDLHEHFSDGARRVPEAGADGTPPRYSAVLVLLGEGSENSGAGEGAGAAGGGEGAEGAGTAGGGGGASGGEDAEGSGDAGGGRASHPGRMLLTHRTPTMRTHSGQMAFPGGGWESQDPDPIHTALREAQEETGLDPRSVTPVAVMQPLYIDRTNFAVVPVLGYWHEPHDIYPATSENDWVQMVPIDHLTDPRQRFTVEFMAWNGPAFYVENMVLWGFTGGVVDALLHRAGWAKPWDKDSRVDLFEALQRSSNGEALGDMRAAFRGGVE